MSDKIEVQVSQSLKAPAERIYEAWLDPEKVRDWLSHALRGMNLSGEIVAVEIDAQVGGAFLFSDLRDGAEAKHWGKYLELQPGRVIAFTWITDPSEEDDPSKVRITLAPEGDGCQAAVVHEMDAKWAEYAEQTKNGWSCMLQASVMDED